MKNPPNQKIVSFTRIKQWIFPLDAECYNILKEAKFPLLRFHQDQLPIVKLILKSRNLQGRLVPFKEQMLNPFLERIGSKWQSKSHRKASITSSTMIFTSSKELEHSKKMITALEGSLRRFFTRWGYTATIDYSEQRGKCKLHVTYKFDSHRQPLLHLAEDPEALPTIRCKLGHVRISLQLGKKFLDITIDEQAGPTWVLVKTSRCLYSQIGDVRPMLQALTDIVNRDIHNFDNPNE